MSDVAQILGLAGSKSSVNGTTSSDLDQLKPSGPSVEARGKKNGSTCRQKKLTGMQREVLELLESNHRASHALYQGFGKTSLKQKWQEHKKSPAVKWLRKSFRNPARASLPGETGGNGLVLSHWGKAHLEKTDYVFARFNIKSKTTSYTDDEYEAVVAHHDDPMMKWTKDETDLLLKLCQRFDLRWVVISDKYNSSPLGKGAHRSIEDIKYRYYEVTRLVTEYRDQKARGEVENKIGVVASSAVAGSTAEAIAAPSRDLTVPGADLAPVATVPTSAAPMHYRFNIAYEKQRKKQLDLNFLRTVDEENEIRRLNDELRGVEQQLKKVAVKVDPKKKKELAHVPYEIKRTLPTGVILRSSLLALPQQKHALSPKLLKKLQLLLDEMGVPARPMPTKPVCETFDKLRQDAVGLLSLRKHLKFKENEVQALRERYQALTGKEYISTTTPVTVSERPGDEVLTVNGSTVPSFANHPPNTISKGKTSKHSEKVIRAAKRRNSSGLPGLSAKRSKKVPYYLYRRYQRPYLTSSWTAIMGNKIPLLTFFHCFFVCEKQ
ncbi:unnamed protein product [Peronospora belbahrii]|uniref:Myb-like domain-containing protein n=1 Tax=Peronospora belbahrii TaxID=622444 RepID=A0AAU9L166_9STRA|nr:unnamed protein product [Peronospora belbahrii]CAH0517493.1 unnamed protein product [Peronospora belbahrii]